MPNRRDLIKEIIEIRGRRRSSHPTLELFQRLLELQSAYENRDKKNPELLKYFPIALVACMEGYFRAALKHLIDSEEKYLENASSLAMNLRFDFEIVKALYGKKISIGEFIAHMISLNNLGHIERNMSQLLGIDFLNKLAIVHDRWATEIKGEPKKPIISDSSTTYRNVAKTFELRHIFCHETATKHEIEETVITDCFDSTVLFLKASDELLSETLHPNAPLTQADMNIESAKEYKKEMETLQKINAKICAKLDETRQKEFLLVHEAWERFMNLGADFEANEYKGGTIWPTIRNTSAASITSKRIEEVSALLEHLTYKDDQKKT